MKTTQLSEAAPFLAFLKKRKTRSRLETHKDVLVFDVDATSVINICFLQVLKIAGK